MSRPRMRANAIVKKSKKYMHFYHLTYNNGAPEAWSFQISRDGQTHGKEYETEKEAAIKVDLFLINRGENPVNILKPKQ